MSEKEKNKKHEDESRASLHKEPPRPLNLPDGAYWDAEEGVWRDRDGNPINPG